jgi:hypothetical protein
MTKKESQQLDMVLFNQVVASIRDIDPTDRLNAFAFDMDLIRNGKVPWCSRDIVIKQGEK